jgi:predicted Holliday junction resolvase-like endonuclease
MQSLIYLLLLVFLIISLSIFLIKLIRRRGKRKIPKNKIPPQPPTDVEECEILPRPFTEEELKIHHDIKHEIAEREQAIAESSCFLCGKEYLKRLDKFYCNYCWHSYCSDHRLPEKHNCIGDPKRPPLNGAVIYSKGKVRYRGRR